MIADEYSIGFESAKLLEYHCSMSKKIYEIDHKCNEDGTYNMKRYKNDDHNIDVHELCYPTYPPAFSWSEILFIYAKEFFGNMNNYNAPELIFKQLIRKNYKKAEQIFIKNCILIK